MAKRLLDRQVSLLHYLTSSGAIFGDQRNVQLDPALRGIDRALLRIEARFSHDKRMEKIVAVFPRTFALLGAGRETLVRDFVDACPPADISRLENARAFHAFLCGRWRHEPPTPPYLCDVAACELACASARGAAEGRAAAADEGGRALEHFSEKWTPVFRRKCDQLKKLGRVSDSIQSKRTLARAHIRRHPGVVLLRSAYDIRPIFEDNSAAATPLERDTRLAITLPSGGDAPSVLELAPEVFDLLAAIEQWTTPSAFDLVSEAAELIADLVQAGLIEVRR
jgi:hypothetical protein